MLPAELVVQVMGRPVERSDDAIEFGATPVITRPLASRRKNPDLNPADGGASVVMVRWETDDPSMSADVGSAEMSCGDELG